MEQSIQVKVLSPQREIANQQATFVKVRAQKGEIGIGANHSEGLVEVAPGPLHIYLKDKETSSSESKLTFFVARGVCYIDSSQVVFMCETVEPKQSIDLKRAKDSERRALQRLQVNSTQTNVDVPRALSSLERARQRVAALQ